MAKRLIKPKSFTDEEGEWKALIGKNIFFVFPTTNNRKLVSSVSLNSGTTFNLNHNSGVSTIVACLFLTAGLILAV